MKKLQLFLILIGSVLLTGCKDVDVPDPNCASDQTLIDGVCVDNEIECDPGYILEGETCVLIDTTTEIERAFANTIDINNYHLDIMITEGTTSITMDLDFDDNMSSFTVNDTTEYYVNNNDVCTKYSVQLDQVVTESIDCIASEDTRFKFFHGFELEWFEEVDNGYALLEGHYALLNNFFRNAQPDAIVSDFVLTVENDYFKTFTFLVTSDNTTYEFVMTFSQFNQVLIELP